MIIIETKFYIAVQDGKYDDNEYDTYEEAVEAREEIKKYDIMTYNSTCIRDRFYRKFI